MTIHVGLEKTNEFSIQRSNNADLAMTIASFFHCKNIPKHIVELKKFRQMIDIARLFRKGFKFPTRKYFGGDYTNSFLYVYSNLT